MDKSNLQEELENQEESEEEDRSPGWEKVQSSDGTKGASDPDLNLDCHQHSNQHEDKNQDQVPQLILLTGLIM